MTYFYGLSEKADVSEIGYKSKMLSEIHLLADRTLYDDLNIIVPETLVLSADFYRDQINALIKRHAALFRNLTSNKHLYKLSRTMSAELSEINLDCDSRLQLQEWLTSFSETSTFVLRTSATFANHTDAIRSGQYGSYFSLTGDQVWHHIKRSLQTMWRPEVINYRMAQGLSHMDTAMAIMIQPMLRADASGIAFSINPLNGEFHESHVQLILPGRSRTDNRPISHHDWTVRWPTGTTALSQPFSTASSEPVAEVIRLSGQTTKLPLSATDVTRLASFTRTVMYGQKRPCSVEWIQVGRQIYLMQTRMQENLPDKLDRASTIHLFPEPLTPLIGDCASSALNTLIKQAGESSGLIMAGAQGCCYRDGFIYGNRTIIAQLALNGVTPDTSLPPDSLEIPEYYRQSGSLLNLPVQTVNDLDAFLAKVRLLQQQDLSQAELNQCQYHLDQVMSLTCEYFDTYIRRTLAKQFFSRHLYHVLASVVYEPMESQQLFLALMGATRTKSSRINQLIRTLVKQMQVMYYHQTERLDPTDISELAHCPEGFRQTLLHCIEHHQEGSDFYDSGWDENPTTVWTLLHDLTARVFDFDIQARLERDKLVALKTLFSLVPTDYHFALQGFVHYAESFAAIETVENVQASQIGQLLRHTLTILGQRFELTDPLDLFFLTRTEIQNLQQWSLPDTLRQRMLLRKTEYLTDRNSDDEDFSGSVQQAVNGTLCGIPASPGIACSVVYRANRLEDIEHMPAGAILVIKSAHPRWLPFFYQAAGIIAEAGDVLSYCAVTAREIGIPAVVGVGQTVSQLRHFQHVEIDGLSGTITLID
ncbi:PEP/pyruvate-binding domain-containing protein [Gynuella sunshinyii]|uniref:Phosphoenolpyruvate synthase/pyruvate phosphate dikinase n=1 Tax=Gynuella sunshinyii YC6258 TaxID=1445510 RepID=A0A0C5VS89_9GAMM|nr:PEP/pyruvate-binding domain-containing protein [Gynuella sunshinyii]AJQ97537.1 phosphoenolpyruvate synthase/pyruvate phosphate dikinase [Gynuella sunshinyii YC6258]